LIWGAIFGSGGPPGMAHDAVNRSVTKDRLRRIRSLEIMNLRLINEGVARDLKRGLRLVLRTVWKIA
jgi:hypothetical protein